MADEATTEAVEAETTAAATEAAATDTQAAPEKPEAAPADWRADLPDDLKKTAERFTSKEDALRAIVAFQKREGQVRVPGKDADAKEVAAFKKALGVPDAPEAYADAFPALKDEELTDDIRSSREGWAKTFHELNVPKAAAQALVQRFAEEQAAALEAVQQADKRFADEQTEALKKEWGGDFDRNKNFAARAFKDMAERNGLDFDALSQIETKDGRMLMDRAEIVKIFAAIGREMGEGSLGGTMTEGDKEAAETQLRELRTQIQDAQAKGESRRANELYQKELSLVARIGGSQPVVGARGRAA